MVTPYDEELNVNYDQAAALAQHLVDNGSDGIVVGGTTGESPVLTKEEKFKLTEVVIDAVGKKAKVWVGTGTNDTQAGIALNRLMEKLPLDGVLSVCPYYNKPTQEGLYQHFKALSQNTSLPIVIYNVPGRTGSSIAPATVVRLAEFDNIIAIKESSGNLDQIAELARELPERVLIYSGDDNLTLPMMSAGAIGVVSVASHICGREIKAMIEAYVAGDVVTARELHLQLYPIFKGLFICSNPIPVKKAVNLIGIPVGGLRLPLVEANPAETEFLQQLVAGYRIK
jgi:4-hydroxy-tetrahydrodipicolinate synthase